MTTSNTPIPIPASLQLPLTLSAHVAQWTAVAMLSNELGQQLPGPPANFRYHHLCHYFASLLIASGANVKIVQARLRRATAKTTQYTHSHLGPTVTKAHEPLSKR